MQKDELTLELQQIMRNSPVGPRARSKEKCACSYCCANRALKLRKQELKRQTTIIGKVNNAT